MAHTKFGDRKVVGKYLGVPLVTGRHPNFEVAEMFARKEAEVYMKIHPEECNPKNWSFHLQSDQHGICGETLSSEASLLFNDWLSFRYPVLREEKSSR